MTSKSYIFVAVFVFLTFTSAAFAIPELNFVAPTPANGTNQSSTTITINITSNETINITPSRIQWTNSTGQILNISSTTTPSLIVVNGSINYTFVTISNLANGVHRFRGFIFSTLSGENQTKILSVTVDTTNSTVNLLAPQDGLNTTNTSIIFQFNITDNIDTNLTYKLWINNAVNQTATVLNNTNVIINVSGLSEGAHNWTVEGVEDSGSAANATLRTFIVDTTAPNVTLTLSKTSLIRGESLDITCGAIDALTTVVTKTITVTEPDGNVVTFAGGTYSDTTKLGTYTVKCTATDGVGNSASKSSTFSTSSAGGGGGGSGAAKPNPKTTFILDVTPGSPGVVRITNNEIGIRQINIEVNNAALNIDITVEKLPGAPATVTKAINRTVFQYLNINAPRLAEKLSKARIEFSVLKTWLHNNGFSSGDIALYRYDGNWTKLDTVVLNETDNEVNYQSTAPSFSVFAIAGSLQEEQTPPPIQPSEPPPEETAPSAPQPPQEQQPEAQTDNTNMILIFGIIIAAVVVVYAGITMSKKPRK